MKKGTQAAAAVMVETSTLQPWSRNPRHNAHAVASIAQSIQRFGFASPIVARKADRRIIAGHTRWLAARELGLAEVPVRFLDLSEQDADALAVADNKLGELASWDDDLLSSLVAEFQDAGVDLDTLGFSEDDVTTLLGEWEDPMLAVDAVAGTTDAESSSDGPTNETDATVTDASSLLIMDTQAVIYVNVSSESSEDAGRAIAQALTDAGISHTIRVK